MNFILTKKCARNGAKLLRACGPLVPRQARDVATLQKKREESIHEPIKKAKARHQMVSDPNKGDLDCEDSSAIVIL